MLKINLLFRKNTDLKNSRILTIKNAKPSGYYFSMNLNIWGDFQIYISVPLKILTGRNLCFTEFSTKIHWNTSWLLPTFFICLHNQLSSFNSIIAQISQKRVHQIDRKNKLLLLSVTFTAILELAFVLTLKNSFHKVFILKPTERA